MTCRMKEIVLWATIKRRLLVLVNDRHQSWPSILRNFSSNGDGNSDSTSSNQSNTTTKKSPIKDIPDEEIQKSVFISQSHDIFTNLALEDWLYRNFDFTTHHVLMLWSNDPCVVVGRHQNPYVLKINAHPID